MLNSWDNRSILANFWALNGTDIGRTLVYTVNVIKFSIRMEVIDVNYAEAFSNEYIFAH